MNLFAETYQMTTTATSGDAAASAAAAVVFMMFGLFMVAISYVVSAFLISRIFKKAGIDQWRAWVPVYNNWITYEMGGQAGWWSVLAFVPVINIASAIIMYVAMYQIGLKFGKSGAFVLWAIFLPLVWWVWLWLDDSKWAGAQRPGQKQPLQPAATA
ncbi:MAG: DUF5684 domain-containing protein [bacterium]|nr:DUF5684 domain-containing protein [bacterium]MDN5835637.1 DUF5684 domain-containing protein [bacterium]